MTTPDTDQACCSRLRYVMKRLFCCLYDDNLSDWKFPVLVVSSVTLIVILITGILFALGIPLAIFISWASDSWNTNNHNNNCDKYHIGYCAYIGFLWSLLFIIGLACIGGTIFALVYWIRRCIRLNREYNIKCSCDDANHHRVKTIC